MNYELYEGDCLEVMKGLDAGSVDAVICDPPYGTTACAWDSVIPFAPMWECIKRAIKPRGAVVLFGSEPFSSLLRCSNLDWYKYDWVWEKNRPTDFVNANNKPLKSHENISIFSDGTTANGSLRKMVYAPVGVRKANICNRRGSRGNAAGERPNQKDSYTQTSTDFPRSVLHFDVALETVHPTQKPVDLMAYLIKTYTNPGDTVLDFTMGSGSTGAAAIETGRKFIGIELDPHYFAVASERIEAAYRKAQGMPRLGKPTDHADLPLFAN